MIDFRRAIAILRLGLGRMRNLSIYQRRLRLNLIGRHTHTSSTELARDSRFFVTAQTSHSPVMNISEMIVAGG
jgi:hypothetical protein